MFRQYEDPHAIKCRLDQAREALENARCAGADPDDLISLYEDVASLEERLNFAWQDDEYDSNYDYDYEYMEV